jgi:hypothetical protein
MKSPFDTPRTETRSIVFDSCVPLGFPQLPKMPTDAEYDELYARRIARNELRRLQADCERISFLKPQAAP